MKQLAVILLFFLYISAPACFGAAVYESTLTVVIPPAASVESIQTGKNSTVINPKDGTHTGLEAVFNIKQTGMTVYMILFYRVQSTQTKAIQAAVL